VGWGSTTWYMSSPKTWAEARSPRGRHGNSLRPPNERAQARSQVVLDHGCLRQKHGGADMHMRPGVRGRRHAEILARIANGVRGTMGTVPCEC
jgi:hypothetical protein